MHFREVRALFSVQRIDKIHPYIILRLTVLSTIQMIDPSNKKKGRLTLTESKWDKEKIMETSKFEANWNSKAEDFAVVKSEINDLNSGLKCWHSFCLFISFVLAHSFNRVKLATQPKKEPHSLDKIISCYLDLFAVFNQLLSILFPPFFCIVVQKVPSNSAGSMFNKAYESSVYFLLCSG